MFARHAATRGSRSPVDVINWHTFFFLLFALATAAFAIAVVLATNVVRMAFYLILSLGATSGLFFLAGADFVGSMQLMIYVGGTVVLLVFGVMLTAQSPFVSLKTSGADWVLAALVSGGLLAVLVPSAWSVPGWRTPAPIAAQQPARKQAALPTAETSARLVSAAPAAAAPATVPTGDSNTATRLGMGLLGARVDRLDREPATLRPGMSGYLLPFEIVSVHLLVVLVGAAYLARAKRRVSSGET